MPLTALVRQLQQVTLTGEVLERSKRPERLRLSGAGRAARGPGDRDSDSTRESERPGRPESARAFPTRPTARLVPAQDGP